MKWNFFIITITLLLIQVNIYAQHKDIISNEKNISSQKNDNEKMFKYLNLSDEQIVKIQAIKKNGETNLKAIKDTPGAQNALLLNMAITQDSIDNLLSTVQKVKMKKFELQENYLLQLKQKITVSQNQEEKIVTICEQTYDKQQAIINNSSLSPENIKQQIGKLNNETSNTITSLLTIEQKKQLEIKKEK